MGAFGLLILLVPAAGHAQPPRTEGSIRITAVDPSGAVIVGAQVTVSSAATGTAPLTLETGGRGDAVFTGLEPDRYRIHVEAPGFEPSDLPDVRVRNAETRREVKLRIAKLSETVEIGRDPRERASDPRSDAFSTVLNQAQIEEPPDDPDEMEQVLREIAGPGATLRVNGFRGGKLPPKNQIQQIRFNELRVQWRGDETGFTPSTAAPAVMVLNAFNSGGAQIAGTRRVNEVQIADDLDIAAGHHAIRTGIQLDAGRYRSSVLRNGGGTFTFSSLAAYAAAIPTIFSRNVGNPDTPVAQMEAGIYIEDDMRVRPNLTISGGLRQEIQSHIGGLHPGPRGGVTWSPFKSGRTTIRAGAGIFLDWFDAQSYEQAVQLDGPISGLRRSCSLDFPTRRPAAARSCCPRGAFRSRPA